MWSVVFGWPVASVVLCLLIGTGVGLMSCTPPEFRVARVCFTLAALIFFAKVGAWLISVKAGTLERVTLTVLIFGVGGLAWIESSRWIEAKRGKQQGTQQPTAALPSLGLPDFKLSILGGNIFVPDQAPSLTGIALDVRIRNAGASSIATDWTMWVTIAGEHSPRVAQFTKPPKQLTLSGKAGKVVLRSSDYLEDRVVSKPLQTGESIGGWLLFYVDVPKSTIQALDTTIELRVSDIRGHVFSAKQRMGDWLHR